MYCRCKINMDHVLPRVELLLNFFIACNKACAKGRVMQAKQVIVFFVCPWIEMG